MPLSVVDAVPVGLRALSFVAVLQAAGVPLFLWLFGDELQRSARSIAALARGTAVVGLILTIAHQIVEPARLAGALRGIFDGPLQAMLLTSDAGTTAAVRVLGLAMVALGCVRFSRFGAAVALVGSTLIVASFAFMGHTASHDQRWLLASLLILHLTVVAFWFGALGPFYLASRHEELVSNGLIIERFSKLAVGLVPVIFVAGLALSLVLLPNLASLRTPYGLLLLLKVTGFAILMGLAALNKLRLGPLISSGRATALRSFRRSVLVEWVLVAGVLITTAAMTELFSPGH